MNVCIDTFWRFSHNKPSAMFAYLTAHANIMGVDMKSLGDGYAFNHNMLICELMMIWNNINRL